MKLVTRFELANLSIEELHGIYRASFNALAASNSDTPERRNALASLDNICRELSCRHSS